MGYCNACSVGARIQTGGYTFMKIQTKSLLSSFGQGRLPGTQPRAAAAGSGTAGVAGIAGMGTAPNLQALAAELHQSATQGLFEYPRRWVQISRGAAVILVALAAF